MEGTVSGANRFGSFSSLMRVANDGDVSHQLMQENMGSGSGKSSTSWKSTGMIILSCSELSKE